MDEHLAYFLDLRNRPCGRAEATAVIDRCIRLIARANRASPSELLQLEQEVEGLRADLVGRFGPKSGLPVH